MLGWATALKGSTLAGLVVVKLAKSWSGRRTGLVVMKPAKNLQCVMAAKFSERAL
jgi:hypothetical protein